MSIINGFMNVLFDALLFPFKLMAPWVGLCVLSVVLGIAFLLLFKYTSPQGAIKRIKDRIKAGLYEVRLYKDDIGIVFRANKSLLAANACYIGCCLVPLVPMIVLILPVLFQLDARYGLAPLAAGRTTTLEVHLDPSVDFGKAEVTLDVPKGLAVEAGPVRIPPRREYAYRLRVDAPGRYTLGITVNGRRFTKRVDAEERPDMVSPKRVKPSLDAFVYPAERPYPPDGPLASVSLEHGRRAMLGMDGDLYPWLWIFCVVALAAGFACKGVFRVNL